MNQKLRDDKDAIEAAHEAVSPEVVYTRLNRNHDQVLRFPFVILGKQ